MYVFIIIAVLHCILQFVAWGFASGNTAIDLSHSFVSKWWPVLSFPAFWTFPKDWSNSYFWMVFYTNSIIWGLAGSVILLLIRK
jgi:hypothetical protein